MDHEKHNIAKHFCFCGKAMIPVVCAICDGCGDDPYRDPSDKYVCGLCDGTGETWRCPDGHTEEIKESPVIITLSGRRLKVTQLSRVLSVSLADVQMPDGYNCYWIPIHSTDRRADMQFALNSLIEDEVAFKIERESRREGDAVLCFISQHESRAVFTTAPLGSQWGDDWNDAPYEHNCGDPYEWRPSDKKPPYALYEVYFKTDMETPAQKAWGGNSLYSVEMINNRETPWLSGEGKAPIYAGVSIAEFKRIIKANGGTIFVPEED